MELKENHKYQIGDYHVVQLEGSFSVIYIILEIFDSYFKGYHKAFSTQQEAINYIKNELIKK